MKRPIKFRGKTCDDNLFIYGDYQFVSCGGKRHFIADDSGRYEVYFDTITQLVGYDADGNEIYEGDKIVAETYGAHPLKLEGTAQLGGYFKSVEGYYAGYEQFFWNWCADDKKIFLKKGDEID